MRGGGRVGTTRKKCLDGVCVRVSSLRGTKLPRTHHHQPTCRAQLTQTPQSAGPPGSGQGGDASPLASDECGVVVCAVCRPRDSRNREPRTCWQGSGPAVRVADREEANRPHTRVP